MSEETTPDTIEKLYERLDDYDKQQLFNYGYLLEYTRKLENEVKIQNNEATKFYSIIKEVREYIENAFATGEEIFKVEILEILDKVDKE